MRHRSYPPVDRPHSLLALGVVLSLAGLTMTMCDARLTRAGEPPLPGAPGETVRTGHGTADPGGPALQQFVVERGGASGARTVAVTVRTASPAPFRA